MEESNFTDGNNSTFIENNDTAAIARAESAAIAESIWPITDLMNSVFANQIVITKVLSVLSAMGSAYIIVHMIHKKKLNKTFDRLLVCLCASDFISSLSLFVASWVVPQDAPPGLNEIWENVWNISDIWYSMFPQALGNTISCTIQGFFLYVGDLMSVLLTGCIAISFLLQVKFQCKDDTMRNIEKYYFWSVSILFPLLTAIIILIDRGFNAIPVGFCYAHMEQVICSVRQGVPWKGAPFEDTITQYCNDNEDHRGKYTDTYLLIFSGLPVVLVLVTNSVCMLILFWSVRNQELRAARWSLTSATGKYQKRVFVKGMMYVGSFLAVRVPYMASLFFYYKGPVVVHYIANFCLPLQGILNVLIYSNMFNMVKQKVSSHIQESYVSTRNLFSRESKSRLSRNSFSRMASHRSKSSIMDDIDVEEENDVENYDDEENHDTDKPNTRERMVSFSRDITNNTKQSELDSGDIILNNDDEMEEVPQTRMESEERMRGSHGS